MSFFDFASRKSWQTSYMTENDMASIKIRIYKGCGLGWSVYVDKSTLAPALKRYVRRRSIRRKDHHFSTCSSVNRKSNHQTIISLNSQSWQTKLLWWNSFKVNLLDLLKPEMHSSKNSKVRWGSLAANVLLMETMKRVLLAGIQRPDVSRSWPSIFKLKVQVKAHNRL